MTPRTHRTLTSPPMAHGTPAALGTEVHINLVPTVLQDGILSADTIAFHRPVTIPKPVD